MANAKTKTRWLVASYSRLSREDAEDRAESNSVSNQKTLIANYIKTQADMSLVEEFVDDGWSGSNFDRPAFKAMLEAIDAGDINCIIVKDLSRFGRNYIGVGRYIERIFPERGIRLIAINDNYDGLDADNYTDSLIIPIKNLVNDNYCASTSVKTKAHLDIKRNNGEYLSNFAPYGYKKDPKCKNKLIVDEEAADVVRQMFSWRIEGYSTQAIAKKLNAQGVLSPHEYMQSKGLNHRAGRKRNLHASWSTPQVIRMLANEVYIGNLLQGKTYKPNFRSKHVVARPEEEWFRSNNTHEPIIDSRTFELTQELSNRDMRAATGNNRVCILSGYIYCAECGNSLTLTSQMSRGKRYSYYKCTTYRQNKNACTSHTISADKLEDAVSQIILNTINWITCTSSTKEEFKVSTSYTLRMDDLELRRKKAIEEGMRCGSMAHQLYDDFKRGIITQSEMTEFQASYSAQAQHYEEQVKELDLEIEKLVQLGNIEPWKAAIERFKGAEKLTRSMLVEFVDRIELDAHGNVNIEYRFHDIFGKPCEVK